MFLFDAAHQVCSETDLRLHFFFAVSVVVVCDDRNGAAIFSAAGYLERDAIVVAFVFGFPAHAILFLPIGRIIDMRKTKIFL